MTADRPVLTVFHRSPDRGRGLARDMRVRWALEEVGLAYVTRFVALSDLRSPGHLALQPFGQIPVYQEGDLALFESGAIVLHVARKGPGLLPEEPVARGRAESWLLAALNTVEPPMVEAETARFTESDRPWYPERRAMVEARIRERLGRLADWLGHREWLEGEFTAGDLMMVSVLLRQGREGLLSDYPTLLALMDRATARPAYARAFAAQKADYEAGAPE